MTRRPWRLTAARLLLTGESLWSALWPVLALVLGFLALAGFDLLPMLPGWLHAGVLALFAGGLVWAGFLAWRGWRVPDQKAAMLRLERDSGLAHRPLGVLDDGLSGGGEDALTQALWQMHRRRMAVAASTVRLGWPRLSLVTRDPYAIRAALALLILIGAIGAGDDFWPRLGRALSPALDGRNAVAAATIDLWITPPDYTGLPPVYLSGDAVATLDIPTGSTMLAQVHGGRRVPRLVLDNAASEFTGTAPGDYTLTATLTTGQSLSVTQGSTTLLSRAIRILPDLPPSVELLQPPQATPRAALRFDYEAKDDYGVSALSLEIRRSDSAEAPLVIALPVGTARKDLKGTSYQDLTPHPWAGLPVEITLIASDAIGQQGHSAPVRLTLPERQFHHPVAKLIIEQRKILAGDVSQSPLVMEALYDVSADPRRYENDFSVFLNLRSAAMRLQRDTGPQSIAAIEQSLWDTALKVEEGDVSEAQKSLRDAQQALQDALDRDAPEPEIERLMGQLKQAIDRYMQAAIQNAGRNGAEQPMQPGGHSVTPQDIDRMLDAAREMSRAGAKDAAREALAQLQDLMESLKTGRMPGGQGGDGKGEAMMRGMQDLQRKQQQLLDRAYEQNQRNPSAPGEGNELGAAQDGLRRQLGDLTRQMGQAGGSGSPALGRADRAMRDAAEALKRGSAGEATAAQGEALSQLQQAAREIAEQMGADGGDGGRDPFGRLQPGAGGLDRGDVKIPESADLQKSREILDELRRRAGDRGRPLLERDYLDRLLKRF